MAAAGYHWGQFNIYLSIVSLYNNIVGTWIFTNFSGCNVRAILIGDLVEFQIVSSKNKSDWLLKIIIQEVIFVRMYVIGYIVKV